jgi:hypothetical protein
MDDPEALLLTGVFGTGKSTIAAEIADILEPGETLVAAIDLDWLTWSNAPGAGHEENTLLARNLRSVVENYREAGVSRFVLAGFVAHEADLAAIRAAMAMPLRIVRLTAPERILQQRLGSSPTNAQLEDFERVRVWLAHGIGVGLEDAEVENTGSIRATALIVLEVMGWA